MSVKDKYLQVDNKNAYYRVFEESQEAPNIIFIMTPIVTVKDPMAESFLEGLISNGCNVFALDFLGTGRSDGSASDINYLSMKRTLLELIKSINENYSNSIHLYGGTGTGGIIGQALCSDTDVSKYIESFIQFGLGLHGDLSSIGNTAVLKAAFPIVDILGKHFPSKKLKFKVPKYSGFNAEKENAWYVDTMNRYPGAFDIQLSLLRLILDLHISKKSTLSNSPACPVLVLASTHDRYFNKDYIQRYFESLGTLKKIIWYEDSHLAFLWRAKEMNDDVRRWILGLA